jgi:DNA-binding Lrp family transcriptional regulator
MTDTNLARHIDRQAARFLRAVEYYGGEATTTEIRQRTGLSRDVANHRFRRLEDLGLIEITYADEGYGDRRPPKVAHLTGIARQEIERGLLRTLRDEVQARGGTVDLQAELREMQERIDQHKRQLNTLTATQSTVDRFEERLDMTEEHLNDLEEYVCDWNEGTEMYLRALRAALEDRGINVEEYLREAQQNASTATPDE